MVKTSYSLNGLTNVDIFKGISELENAGYSWFEFSFQKELFDPKMLTNSQLKEIKTFLERKSIRPACISTATTFYLSTVPHEPSVLSLDAESRKKRINLIKRGIDIARILNVPIVSFQSGYIRKEHESCSPEYVRNLLIDSIQELLSYIGDSPITLVIEPEPGMYIETIADAMSLINEIASSHFLLHLDVGHAFCTEENYLHAIKDNLNHTAYIHIADIKNGVNVKTQLMTIEQLEQFLEKKEENKYFLLFNENTIFYDGTSKNIYLFCDDERSQEKEEIENIIVLHNSKSIPFSQLGELDVNRPIYPEAKAYIDSIGNIDRTRLFSLLSVIAFLREGTHPIIGEPICNTVNGKVHFHKRLGFGHIDLSSVLQMIEASSYQGVVTVELYNHVSMWEKVVPESIAYIYKCITPTLPFDKLMDEEWNRSLMGDTLDHTVVKSPYIRVIDYKIIKNSELVISYDLRFVQPSEEVIPVDVMHSLEHLLLKEFRLLLKDRFVLLSPMGCQTGFYLVALGYISKKEMKALLEKALLCVVSESVVPYANRYQCGNPNIHNLISAKEYASRVLHELPSIFNVY